jgi:hypothetical protein
MKNGQQFPNSIKTTKSKLNEQQAEETRSALGHST